MYDVLYQQIKYSADLMQAVHNDTQKHYTN